MSFMHTALKGHCSWSGRGHRYEGFFGLHFLCSSVREVEVCKQGGSSVEVVSNLDTDDLK